MKKFTLLTATLLLVLFANAQIVNIPDAIFKAYLVIECGDTINTNGDGEIQVSEANAFTGGIYVHQKNISDLTGIEAFTALTTLDCNYNQLSTLDLSNNIALTYLSCGSNQITSLDVSNNTALTYLDCVYNQLISLDLSNNTALIYLNCNVNQISTLNVSNNAALNSIGCVYNQLSILDVSACTTLNNLNCDNNILTSLDLSNNTALTNLNCEFNQLININLSTCTALTFFRCNNNQLSTLDVSNNTLLPQVYCSNNQLNSLDLSNNTALTYIECAYNQLSSLNLRNGVNTNMADSILLNNNPNLYCVQVDDPFWSMAHWTIIDSQTFYGYNCFYNNPNPNSITGSVLIDDNCTIEGTELGMGGIIVKTSLDVYYDITDNTGGYTISTDTGTYQVEQVIPVGNGLFLNTLCPIPNYYTVHFDSLGMDTTNINFFNEAIACPYLTIDLTSNRRRRCFTNNTFINYCNEGFADEDSVEVHVQLPDYVIFVSANYPYTIDTLGNYVFDIGNLAQGDCGDIHIIDSVACINGITGLTQCTEVWITPPNDCANQLDTAAYNAWDKSSVMVEGECIGDTIIRFIITNTGDFGMGDMQVPSEYRIYEDNALVYTGSFQLLGQEELIIDIPANGYTYRLEADQHPMHPGNSHPNETIEACGNPNNSSGFVNTMPQDDEDAEIEIDCMEIIDSYDPNDKSVIPQGITANNYIMPGTSLDYVIRFQNTGSDTAFTVIVVDTLSSHLDISTFQTGISSHNYTLDVSGHGRPVLMFTFNNINLPDSTTNEANSHGFVKFKIAPYDTLVNGTVVQNTADIYFDYNIPVITNTSQVIISDTVIHGNPLIIHDIKKETQITDIKIYPNPTTNKVFVEIKNEELRMNNCELSVFDIYGKEVLKTEIESRKTEVNLSTQPKGIYIIKVTTKHGVGIKKIVKQ